MAQRHADLVDQIERDTLDQSVPIAAALRKCIVLGGRSGSEQLRAWATRELEGYHGQEDLPDYRTVHAPLMIDGISGNYQIKRQQFPPSALPEFAREHISEKVQLRDGVGGIAALLQQAEIKLMPAGASDLTRLMNARDDNPYQHIEALYWGVSHAAVEGVVDQIRTALTKLVAELRANMSAGQEIPSTEAANQAVNVVVTGKRSKVSVTSAQANGVETEARSDSSTPTQNAESGFWTRSRRIGAFVVGFATVTGTAVVLIEAL